MKGRLRAAFHVLGPVRAAGLRGERYATWRFGASPQSCSSR
jgi:hypothetical protein